MELFCLFTTLAIFSAYFSALSLRQPVSTLYNFLSASVLTCAQIILTELVLGLSHQLYLSSLVVVNLSLAGLVLVRASRKGAAGARPLRESVARIQEATRAAFDRYSIILGILALSAYGWILAAAYFLPPRGIDDNVYHLPAILEYVQSHEIRTLPVDIMWPFAYPQNAELLFLWPVLFTHSQQWLDGMNVPFVLLSVLTVYALLRHFAICAKDALFAALLYALCPVVLMLAGVNYVDIIVSLFLLLSLYFAILFFEHERLLDFYLAGLAIGLMCGMKYTALVLAPPLLALIIPRLGKGRRRHAIGFLAVAAAAGGWWYARNAFLLGDPMYPVRLLSSLPRSVGGTQGGNVVQNILYNAPYWLTRYPLADAGVGKYDGGFGLVFWGMCFLSWLLMSVQSLIAFRRTRFSVFIVLAYLPVGFLVLFMVPPRWIHLNGRFSLFVVAVGLFAFAAVLRQMKDAHLVSIIKALCILLSAITVSLLSVSDRPSYRLTEAVSDAVHHVASSPYKYLADSIAPHAMLRPAWETLDILTRGDSAGMNCASAATQDPDLFVLAPLYGSKLQNRVLNMGRQPVRADAYILPYLDRNNLGASVPFWDGAQLRSMTIRDMMTRDDYVAVVQTDHVCLLLDRDRFNSPSTQHALLAFYRTTVPDAVAAAEVLARELDPAIPLITSSEIGSAVRTLAKGGAPGIRVYLAFHDREDEVAARLRLKQCYTLDSPLPASQSRKILHTVYRGKGIDLYLNRKL